MSRTVLFDSRNNRYKPYATMTTVTIINGYRAYCRISSMREIDGVGSENHRVSHPDDMLRNEHQPS